MIPTSPISWQLGAVICERRTELGWTQAELARRIGTARPLVSRIESGTHRPSLDTMFAYAVALELEPEELVRRARIRSNPDHDHAFEGTDHDCQACGEGRVHYNHGR